MTGVRTRKVESPRGMLSELTAGSFSAAHFPVFSRPSRWQPVPEISEGMTEFILSSTVVQKCLQ